MNQTPRINNWASRALQVNNDSIAHHALMTGLLYRAVDLAAVSLAAYFAGVLAFAAAAWLSVSYQVAILINLLLVVIVFDRLELYVPWRGRGLGEQLTRLALAWAVVFALMIVAAFLVQLSASFSRRWVVAWFFLGFMTLAVFRGIVVVSLRSLRSRGWNHKKVVIVGASAWGRHIAQRIQSTEWLGFDIKCFVDPDPDSCSDSMDGFELAGHYDRLPSLLAEGDVDEVWICLPLEAGDSSSANHVENVLALLKNSLVNQRVVPDMAEFRILERPMTDIAGIPFINLSTSPYQGINRFAKLVEDFVLGSLILLCIAPFMVLIALLIKATSPGPVFFTQLRHGWDGKPFNVLKFRTMYVHREPEGAVTQATPEDERVTPLGRILRSSSLDELPQFINVLKGEMSIVGPRPHAIVHNEMFKDRIDYYMHRHRVKPGITGWAQVNGWRGQTDTLEKMRRRIELDLFYIEHWSLAFDIKILILTLLRGFRHSNAY